MTNQIAKTSFAPLSYLLWILFSFFSIQTEACEVIENIEHAICENQTYTFGDYNLTEAGIYTDTLVTELGCDSVVVLDLEVNPIQETLITESICQGDSMTVGDQKFSSTGVYEIVLQSELGCDSVVVLDLEVNPIQETLITESICQGNSITVGGQEFSSTGVYEIMLQSELGCDSVMVLDLKVNSIQEILITESICQGDSIAVGGQVFSSTGVYEIMLQSELGCDSVVTLDLTVHESSHSQMKVMICEGQTFQVGGEKFDESGIYTILLESSNSCDSIVELHLQVIPIEITNLSIEICEGDSFEVGSNIYTESGIYQDTFQTDFLCDSIVITQLTVHEIERVELIESICSGSYFQLGDNQYFESGNYLDTLSSSLGCDSIVSLNLSVEEAIFYTQEIAVCEGESYTIGNHTYEEAGIYLDTLTSVYGCDSIVTTSLVVNPVYSHSYTVLLCEGEAYKLGDLEIVESGKYEATFTSIHGCDSTVTIQAIVHEKDYQKIHLEACQGESISIDGVDFYSDTLFVQSFKNRYDCDSIIEYELTFHPTFQEVIYENVCRGTEYQNIEVNQDTLINLYLQTIYGCDSLVQVNITVVEPSITYRSHDICYGDEFRGEKIFEDDVIYTNYTNQWGCDSVVVDSITVLPIPNLTVSQDTTIIAGSPITLIAGGASSYQWSTGRNSSFIQVSPTVTTTYTVEAFSDNGCSVSADIQVTVESCEVNAPSYFTPNGDGVHDLWKMQGLPCLHSYNVFIINRLGHVVYSTDDLHDQAWDGTYKGKNAPEGVYFYLLEGYTLENKRPIKKSDYIHLKR